MFELRAALKYLTPKWRQLSVSIISMISILVISLVVWLLVVFFSVTWGLEKTWVQKLVALTSPVRITPTKAYFDSYYYKIDEVSEKSGWKKKTIGEKLKAKETDPWDPTSDGELGDAWPQPDLKPSGELKDPVKSLFAAIGRLKGVTPSEYTTAFAELNLNVDNDKPVAWNTFLTSYDPNNTYLQNTLLDENGALCKKGCPLPQKGAKGEPVVVPKGFKDHGVKIGDAGFISWTALSATSIQNQKLPVVVAGFFDPGLVPLGGRMVLAKKEIAEAVAALQPEGEMAGIQLLFDRVDDAETIKNQLLSDLEKEGLLPYWKIETFREFEFSKDFLQQLRSERNLFGLIAAIIILVACSNIISMLIILVNDKKKEVGVLRAMGASSFSIAAIFGTAGFLMGAFGSALGLIAALITLQNLPALIGLMSQAQGFDAFNPLYFGDTLPNDLSLEAVLFVLGVTSIVSLAAGVLPALKACTLEPSSLLRSE